MKMTIHLVLTALTLMGATLTMANRPGRDPICSAQAERPM